MTILSTVRKAGPSPGNGVTTIFPFAFKVFTAADLVVTQTVIATGAESTLVLNDPLGYTVALNADQNANPGGTITYNPLGVPMPATLELTITSNVSILQTLALAIGGGFNPQTISDALDRAIICIQQLALSISGALRVSVSDSVPNPIPSAAARANNFLAFDGVGNPIVATGITGAPVSGAMAPVVAAATLALGAAAFGVPLTTAVPPNARTITGTSGLAGGGDLSANRTLTLDMTSKNTWTGTQKAGDNALTSGASSDFTAGQQWTVNVNGSLFTIANPSAVTDKTYIAIDITFTTSNTVAFGANYKNVAQYIASATAGKTDTLLFRVRGTNLELVASALDTGKA